MSENAAHFLRQHLQQFGVTMLPNLLLDAYKDLNIDEKELVLLLHLLRCDMAPEPVTHAVSDYLMDMLGRSRSEVAFLLRRLHGKGILHCNRDPGTLTPHDVSLQPLYVKLLLWSDTPPAGRKHQIASPFEELVRLFENVFSNISEIEYERLTAWVEEDHWPIDVVKEALRIAVLNRKLTFRYIDRILLNWQRNNYRTLEEVLAANKAFDESRAAIQEEQNSEAIRKVNFISASRAKRSKGTPTTTKKRRLRAGLSDSNDPYSKVVE